ncbi:MAG: hypothetical protein KF690_00630, partial [Bacteroidetes bacterium]|nr:hypothetical protein [Bacteroidota bacterium]
GLTAVGLGLVLGFILRKKDLSALPLDAWHTGMLDIYRLLARGLVRLGNRLAAFDLRGIDGAVHAVAHLFAGPRPTPSLSAWAANTDHHVVDGAVRGAVRGLQQAGKRLRRAQSGRSQWYFLLSLLLLAALLLFTLLL